MAKPFSLQAVQELMQNRADAATAALAKLIAAEHDARAKLDLLRQYRDEYAQRFSAATQQGLSPQEWRNFRDFMGRLDEAIGQQEQVVARSSSNTAAGQAHWNQQHVKLKAMDTLAERHRSSEDKAEARREQKLLDEIATRRFTEDGNDR